MDDLDLLDSLFSDPPAVRWRREEAYLLKQDGLGSSPKKRKNKSPYGELKRVPVKATSRRGRVVVPCEAPAPETVDDELAKERRALRRKAKVLRQRERALVARESKARVVAESCAAATAAANAAAMISKRLATKLSKRTATLAALQDCLKLSPPLKHHQPPVVEVDAPKARRKKTGTSSTKKLAEPPPSADDEAASMPLEAVGWTQRLGGDVVELLPSDPIIVAWRELARDGTAASTTAPRRQRRRVRVLQYDADMEPCGEIQCDATITSAEEVLSSPRVFAAALVLDDSPSTPLAAGLAAGANKKNNCDHKPVFFEDFAGRRLRAWTMPSEEVGAALSTELSACFGEHVFPPSSSENLSRFVCGVVFRRRGDGAPLLKFVAARLDREKSEPPCGAFGPCAKTLALARVNPYAVVRVEHCLDCEAHETTTKHVPGTYARRFERLAAYVRRRAPHAIVVAANGPTRIGAFEVRCQGYLFRAPTLVHSKFGSEAFPAHADVVAILRAETTEARSEEEEEEEEEGFETLRSAVCGVDERWCGQTLARRTRDAWAPFLRTALFVSRRRASDESDEPNYDEPEDDRLLEELGVPAPRELAKSEEVRALFKAWGDRLRELEGRERVVVDDRDATDETYFYDFTANDPPLDEDDEEQRRVDLKEKVASTAVSRRRRPTDAVLDLSLMALPRTPAFGFVDLPESFTDLYTALVEHRNSPDDDPALCLLTGRVVQAGKRAAQDAPGACTLHARTNGGVGVFFLALRCSTLLVSGSSAAYSVSLYLDDYGEEDVNLRRGAPLHLSRSRLRLLERLYNDHGVPAEVARRRAESPRVIRDNFY